MCPQSKPLEAGKSAPARTKAASTIHPDESASQGPASLTHDPKKEAKKPNAEPKVQSTGGEGEGGPPVQPGEGGDEQTAKANTVGNDAESMQQNSTSAGDKEGRAVGPIRHKSNSKKKVKSSLWMFKR